MEIIFWIAGALFTYGFVAEDEMTISQQIILTFGCFAVWPLILGFNLNA